MPQTGISTEEQAIVAALVARERPQIDRAARKMIRHLTTMSEVGQKQAICQMVSAWILAMGRDQGKDFAFSLSEEMRFQTDLYLHRCFTDWSEAH